MGVYACDGKNRRHSHFSPRTVDVYCEIKKPDLKAFPVDACKEQQLSMNLAANPNQAGE